MSILVGCPVYKRGWVLPRWFEHVDKACAVAGVEPEFAFVVDPRDDETMDAITEYPGVGYVWGREEDEPHPDERKWNTARWHWMVELRNDLLAIARAVQPDFFLSVDSDILLHPDALKNMLETAEQADAVGGKVYMTPLGRQFPSYATLKTGGLKREESSDVFRTEIIMALKLMKPAAYNVDYAFHEQGEDIGWSLACKEAGLVLKWDGRVASKHVMSPELLDVVDQRVGF
jgi:hypothetical protein